MCVKVNSGFHNPCKNNVLIANNKKCIPYLRLSEEKKSNRVVQINYCALSLITIKYDPVKFIFRRLFLSFGTVNQNHLIKYV